MKQKPRYSLKREVERIKRRNTIIFFAISSVIFIYLIGAILFGEMGLLKYKKLNEVKVTLETEIKNYQSENNKLKTEVKALKEDPYYIEKHAREEFGLAREGEYIFQFQQSKE
ncbi:MAG: septum formation initiator family protein [Thermodesulfovibrionales bacterium]|nr:septum formation initiator family protein [Thermodesulfovibrionales bacterium]